ncbi:MAG: carbon storage regulator [Eubacteriales bacterium]
MLIITRKLGEGISIGDNVELVINEISDGKVKIAIEAPKEVKILRKELVEAAAMNKEAAESMLMDKVQVIKKLKK